mgnify:CR=1 FL=1
MLPFGRLPVRDGIDVHGVGILSWTGGASGNRRLGVVRRVRRGGRWRLLAVLVGRKHDCSLAGGRRLVKEMERWRRNGLAGGCHQDQQSISESRWN